MDIVAKNSMLLSIPVKAGQQSYNFGVQETLNGQRLKHLLFIRDAMKSPQGADNLQNNAGVYVRLTDKSNEQIHDHIPAVLLDYKAGQSFMFETNSIAWEKSTVYITDPSGIPANSCVLFLAIYE